MLRQKCAGIEEPEVRSRCEAERRRRVAEAINYIRNANVDIRQREDGYVAIFDEATAQSTARRGSNAGHGRLDGFDFTDEDGTPLRADNESRVLDASNTPIGRHLLVAAYSYPQARGPAGAIRQPDERSETLDQQNEGIGSNTADQALADKAPMIIKTPTGAIREIWAPGGCTPPMGCEREPGTPFPSWHYR